MTGWIIIQWGNDKAEPRVASYTGFGGGDVYRKRKHAQDDLDSFEFLARRHGWTNRYVLAEVELPGWTVAPALAVSKEHPDLT